MERGRWQQQPHAFSSQSQPTPVVSTETIRSHSTHPVGYTKQHTSTLKQTTKTSNKHLSLYQQQQHMGCLSQQLQLRRLQAPCRLAYAASKPSPGTPCCSSVLCDILSTWCCFLAPAAALKALIGSCNLHSCTLGDREVAQCFAQL